MKTINEWFTDKEHKDLVNAKSGQTWRDFILTLIKKGKKL